MPASMRCGSCCCWAFGKRLVNDWSLIHLLAMTVLSKTVAPTERATYGGGISHSPVSLRSHSGVNRGQRIMGVTDN